MRRPAPTSLFTGRDAELARLESALSKVSVGWVYGVAGVGKTTLVTAFAGRYPSAVVFSHAASAPIDALIDDARRELGPRQRPEPRDFSERLSDLVRRLDAARAIWIVDDAHALGDEVSTSLVTTLAGSLGTGRALFTSRHRLLAPLRAPDRLELRLEGLDEEAARRLWSSLDELYGTTGDFHAALSRSSGNPLWLRRAHAGPLDDEDVFGSDLMRLEADERRLALVLGLAGRPLPVAALEGLLPPARLRPALRALATALVAEIDAAGAVRVHDLFRDALLTRTDAPEQEHARTELCRILPAAGLDPAITLREIARQLAALKRFEELDGYLMKRIPELVRAGATGELLRAIELVPPERRSVALSVERARCMGRHWDMPRAYAELARLVRETPEPLPHELAYAFAEAAYDVCNPEQAEKTLGSLLADPTLEPELRVRSLVRYSASLTVLGRGEEGRALLARAEESTDDPMIRARYALQQAMSLNADEEYEAATQFLRRARALLGDAALDEHAVFIPLTFAVIYARAGRFADADALLSRLELDTPTEDESARIFVLASRASILFERGERLASLAPRLEVEHLNRSLGGVHYALTGAIWLSRALFSLGRAGAAEDVLESALAEARALGCHALAARLEKSRRWDPRVQIELCEPAPPPEKRGELARHWVLSALRAAADGDREAARHAVDVSSAHCRGPGYGLDRAIAKLALAFSDEGDPAPAALAEAKSEAQRDGADEGLVLELEAWARARRAKRNEPAGAALVVDARTHEICFAETRLPLKSRPVLRRLLYALAARPNQAVSKEDLVQSVWSASYDPRRHDTPLWQNVTRLRKILGAANLGIEVDEDGYRLVAPPAFRFEK